MICLSEQLEDIRGRLEAIAEELADLALDRLKESLADGTDASAERRLTRARKAVEKAAAILGSDSLGSRSEDEGP
ncbi:MAG TPA: hypothetical protein VK988_20380 [Acidimicrobiales bacterium]|nr:hypothetical protein [Acidimicrobiales bacterium]